MLQSNQKIITTRSLKQLSNYRPWIICNVVLLTILSILFFWFSSASHLDAHQGFLLFVCFMIACCFLIAALCLIKYLRIIKRTLLYENQDDFEHLFRYHKIFCLVLGVAFSFVLLGTICEIIFNLFL